MTKQEERPLNEQFISGFHAGGNLREKVDRVHRAMETELNHLSMRAASKSHWSYERAIEQFKDLLDRHLGKLPEGDGK